MVEPYKAKVSQKERLMIHQSRFAPNSRQIIQVAWAGKEKIAKMNETPSVDTDSVWTDNSTDNIGTNNISTVSDNNTPSVNNLNEPTTPTSLDIIQTAGENQAKKEKQDYLATINYQAWLFDRRNENNQINFDRWVENLDQRMEVMRENVNNQISDVQRMAERNVNATGKIGALTGNNRSSWFINGLNNVIEDSNRTVDRLKRSLEIAQNATNEDKQRLMEDFEREKKRATEDFNFQFRELLAETKITVSELVDTYGLDSDKLESQLDKIDLDIAERQSALMTNYINQLRSIDQMTFDQIDRMNDQATQDRELMSQRKDQFMTWAMNRNMSDINMLISQWQLDVQTGQNILAEMLQTTIDTLSVSSWIPDLGIQFQQQIQQWLLEWKTPYQILNDIVQSQEYQDKRAEANAPTFAEETARMNALSNQELNKLRGDQINADIAKTNAQTNEINQDIDWSQLPLANRNNNPGNLRSSNAVDWTPWEGWFARFATLEEWRKALESDITAKLTGRSPATKNMLWKDADTLQEVISVYAPAGDWNNPQAYAQSVANQLWISPDEPVENLVWRVPELAKAMARHEWFVDSVINSDSVQELSPSAKEVRKWNVKLSDYSSSDRQSIIEELSRSWYFDQPGIWNSDFQKLKTSDRQGLIWLITTWDKIQEMMKLSEDVNTWPRAWRKWSIWQAVWVASDDFVKLRSITGKELSKLMKEISWAAVSEQEVDRIKQYMPNVNQQDKTFDVNVWLLKQEYDSLLSSKVKEYWFDNLEDMKLWLWLSNDAIEDVNNSILEDFRDYEENEYNRDLSLYG